MPALGCGNPPPGFDGEKLGLSAGLAAPLASPAPGLCRLFGEITRSPTAYATG